MMNSRCLWPENRTILAVTEKLLKLEMGRLNILLLQNQSQPDLKKNPQKPHRLSYEVAHTLATLFKHSLKASF